MARSIFASFSYDGDAVRVQQVLNMGAIEGDSLVSAQAWDDKRPLVGSRIHGLNGLNGRTASAVANALAKVRPTDGSMLDSHISLHNPPGTDSKAVNASIANHVGTWVVNARKRA